MGGAALETFMVYTGFYKVATRKAAEHTGDTTANIEAREQLRLSHFARGVLELSKHRRTRQCPWWRGQ